ncbi:MAG: hypothetical protein A2157_11680 [Deltaproteobacteria bacterium RBG_16_47_11]|nr:MAG: hypothetical protein A2157_11680 [Deltaproteobacteria bacterium RBG_16_47_11]
MMIKKGDTFRHRLNRHIYQVVLVKLETVVLQSVKGSSNRLWFGAEDVQLFFETMERRKNR